MSMGALIEKFRSVGLERLERMNDLLILLEREPNDAEALDEILREIHTLKGEAKMMGFADVNLVAHQAENILLQFTDNGQITSTAPLNLLFEGLDLMRGLLTKSVGDAEKDLDLNRFIDNVLAASKDLPSQPPPHTQPQTALPPDKKPLTPTSHIDLNDGPGRTTHARIEAPPSEQALSPDPSLLKILASSTLRVEIDKLERIGELTGEALLMGRRLSYRLDQLLELRLELKQLFGSIEGNLPKTRAAALRNLIHRFDAAEAALREQNHLVNLRASQLDEQTRTLRHIPLAEVLSHYPRALRDLANAQGKDVRIIHSFGNVQVDRAILSALSEPLLHLARNAVDHGIEPPDERIAAGKSPDAEIRLTADYFANSLRVVLSDDGRGIDPQLIRDQAIHRGLLPPEQARQLSDQEAMALIFEPGFSTKEQVSDVSGRGIGMSVVRRQIARIGGFIEIESQLGQRTTFTLHLPTSSAINAVLTFTIGDQLFALTAKDVVRVEMLNRQEIKKIHGGPCIQIDGQIIPIVDWSHLLGEATRHTPKEMITLLLVQKGARTVAVLVDQVIGEQEAISRPLGEFLAGINVCRGVALTDSGAVVPLLNAMELIEESTTRAAPSLQLRAPGRAFATVQGQKPSPTQTILVVEDSEVTRSLVVSILKNQGYRVIEADDGTHGWSRLQRNKIDLVLTDVQMPGMDGLQLLRHIRDSPDFATLPVIILSTLGEAEDKKRAMSLGANGYLVKLSFQEKELLDTVRRYLA